MSAFSTQEPERDFRGRYLSEARCHILQPEYADQLCMMGS